MIFLGGIHISPEHMRYNARFQKACLVGLPMPIPNEIWVCLLDHLICPMECWRPSSQQKQFCQRFIPSWWIEKSTTAAHRTATLAIIKCWFYFLEFAHLVCSRADFHSWNFRTTFASPKSSEFVSMQTKHSVEDVRVLHRKSHPECRQVSDVSAFLGDRYPSAVYCGEGLFKVGQTEIYPYTNWSWIQIEHCIDTDTQNGCFKVKSWIKIWKMLLFGIYVQFRGCKIMQKDVHAFCWLLHKAPRWQMKGLHSWCLHASYNHSKNPSIESPSDWVSMNFKWFSSKKKNRSLPSQHTESSHHFCITLVVRNLLNSWGRPSHSSRPFTHHENCRFIFGRTCSIKLLCCEPLL